MAVLELLDSLKVVSRKIWVIEKSLNFHTMPQEPPYFHLHFNFIKYNCSKNQVAQVHTYSFCNWLVPKGAIKTHFPSQCGNYGTVWKFQNFFPTAKILRQIDLQCNSLVKYSIWRNFCKKIVREKFANFHTEYGNPLWRIFGKNSVKVMVLLNKLLKS